MYGSPGGDPTTRLDTPGRDRGTSQGLYGPGGIVVPERSPLYFYHGYHRHPPSFPLELCFDAVTPPVMLPNMDSMSEKVDKEVKKYTAGYVHRE